MACGAAASARASRACPRSSRTASPASSCRRTTRRRLASAWRGLPHTASRPRHGCGRPRARAAPLHLGRRCRHGVCAAYRDGGDSVEGRGMSPVASRHQRVPARHRRRERYTGQLARALAAAGDDVHVWCPGGARPVARGVSVHAALGSHVAADLRRVDAQLDACPGPRRLLVQWVPHGFGYRSMNLWFCLWLARRARARRPRRADGARAVHGVQLALADAHARWPPCTG